MFDNHKRHYGTIKPLLGKTNKLDEDVRKRDNEFF